MVHDRPDLADEARRAALAARHRRQWRLRISAARRFMRKHHAHAQPQHQLAHSKHQSDGDAAGQSEHRRQDRDARVGRTPRISAAAVSAASRIGARSLPYARYSPNLYPACSYAYRDSDGECRDQTARHGRWRRRRAASGKKSSERPAPQRRRRRRLDLRTIARRIRGRDRRLAVRRAGRRAGAASRPGADRNRRIFR